MAAVSFERFKPKDLFSVSNELNADFYVYVHPY